jgi:hypothetical protein
MNTRDYFAGQALDTVTLGGNDHRLPSKAAAYAYDYADAMVKERQTRKLQQGKDGPMYAIGSAVDLADWPSFSETTQEGAKDAAERLIVDDVPFHVQHDGVWVFTVLDDDWMTEEDRAYRRLGGGE